MSAFKEGSVGHLTSTSAKRPFAANGNKFAMNDPLYQYIGLQKGVGVVHHLFKSVNGGYRWANCPYRHRERKRRPVRGAKRDTRI